MTDMVGQREKQREGGGGCSGFYWSVDFTGVWRQKCSPRMQAVDQRETRAGSGMCVGRLGSWESQSASPAKKHRNLGDRTQQLSLTRDLSSPGSKLTWRRGEGEGSFQKMSLAHKYY